jgi:methylenetetrahydrofolate reductase (NADPH)
MDMNKAEFLARLRAPKRPTVSVEFFPPKTNEDGQVMLKTAKALHPFGIDFASITYGAGGSDRSTVLEYGQQLVAAGFPLIAHLTCVGHTQSELLEIIAKYEAAGFSGILALRGDPPKGQKEFVAHPKGFAHAFGLVQLIQKSYPNRFAVGVAGFPERHPNSPDDLSDIRHLAGKVSAGADFVTTQLFLDNEDYFRFVDRARAAGVAVPVLPGIMPVLSLKQARRFCGFCQAKIPPALEAELLACGEDEEAQRKVGVSWAVRQIRGLLARGVPGYHVYILNRSQSAIELFNQLRR